MFNTVALLWLIKKKDISTLPDWIYLLFLVHMHSNLIVNSAVNLNSPLKHPSTNLCLRKLGYLTDDALNCPVTFMLWISLFNLGSFLFFCFVATSISSPYFSQLLTVIFTLSQCSPNLRTNAQYWMCYKLNK